MNALISEVAFRALFQAQGSAEESARSYIARLPRGDAISRREFTTRDRREIGLLSENILAYIQLRNAQSEVDAVLFQPRLAGCGTVEPAQADVLLGREIIEIKAVQRPFRSYDLRQSITYAALAYSTGIAIDTVTLLNPRWGTYHRVDVADLAPDIGAGSWAELLKDLVDAMSGLEVSL